MQAYSKQTEPLQLLKLVLDKLAQKFPKRVEAEIAKRIHRSPSLVWHYLSGQFRNLTG